MDSNRRKPSHPGIVLDEHYIQPLQLNLQKLADDLGISRNTLYELRIGKAPVSAHIALRLSKIFNTSPELWLNLQQKYDLWCAMHESKRKGVRRGSRVRSRRKAHSRSLL